MNVRPDEDALGPEVAGLWYPAAAEALATTVDELLGAAETDDAEPTEPVRALIAPHAGFRYSGAVAARVFSRLRDRRPARVWLLGPSHRAGFRGAVVPRSSGYRTPLGTVPLDRPMLDSLAGAAGFSADDSPFRNEHSLEAELPFLQRVLDSPWTLVPILIGWPEPPELLATLRDALAERIDPDDLCVVSSDLTHYGRRFGYEPFRERIPQRIEQLDRGALDRILAGDVAAFDAYLAQTGATICGRHPIRLLLHLLGRRRGRLAAYDSSGRMTGDWAHSVSYASCWFPKTAGERG